MTVTKVMGKEDAKLYIAKLQGDQPAIAAETEKQRAASGYDDPYRDKILAMLRGSRP